MIEKKMLAREVWRKPGCVVNNKPMLLFLSFGTVKINGEKFSCLNVRGIKNPLPFKEAYNINGIHVCSWLKQNGWEKIGSEYVG